MLTVLRGVGIISKFGVLVISCVFYILFCAFGLMLFVYFV